LRIRLALRLPTKIIAMLHCGAQDANSGRSVANGTGHSTFCVIEFSRDGVIASLIVLKVVLLSVGLSIPLDEAASARRAEAGAQPFGALASVAADADAVP
jgi:hypothetical protein